MSWQVRNTFARTSTFCYFQVQPIEAFPRDRAIRASANHEGTPVSGRLSRTWGTVIDVLLQNPDLRMTPTSLLILIYLQKTICIFQQSTKD